MTEHDIPELSLATPIEVRQPRSHPTTAFGIGSEVLGDVRRLMIEIPEAEHEDCEHQPQWLQQC
jgi:hypothetical protein